ncbi:MAG: SRPBCC family protein [Nocardioidaceae bacterium]|nr:SRPBCC family protein [Nocardioidaceae bacterium]NUS50722.1 SRPBCC family protein [Nocardioidaceae bacterium]
MERRVDVAAPAALVWALVTDWPRQGDWVPMTRVERVDGADGVGGRFRAWTGIGPVGFWDPMTITSWERGPDGGGRCEVLHRGRVVRGEGEFLVEAYGADASRFTWAEVVDVPLGRLGALGWRLLGPVVGRVIDGGLHRLREVAERSR